MKWNEFLYKFRNLSVTCYAQFLRYFRFSQRYSWGFKFSAMVHQNITTQVQTFQSRLLSPSSGLSSNHSSFLLLRKNHATFKSPTRTSPISYIDFSMRLILIGLLWKSSETISSMYQSTWRHIPKDWKVRIFFRMDLREISGEKRSWWNGRVADPGTGLRMLDLGVLLPEVGCVFVQPSSLLHGGCQTPENTWTHLYASDL